jgi:hypothetical protein
MLHITTKAGCRLLALAVAAAACGGDDGKAWYGPGPPSCHSGERIHSRGGPDGYTHVVCSLYCEGGVACPPADGDFMTFCGMQNGCYIACDASGACPVGMECITDNYCMWLLPDAGAP